MGGRTGVRSRTINFLLATGRTVKKSVRGGFPLDDTSFGIAMGSPQLTLDPSGTDRSRGRSSEFGRDSELLQSLAESGPYFGRIRSTSFQFWSTMGPLPPKCWSDAEKLLAMLPGSSPAKQGVPKMPNSCTKVAPEASALIRPMLIVFGRFFLGGGAALANVSQSWPKGHGQHWPKSGQTSDPRATREQLSDKCWAVVWQLRGSPRSLG